MTGLLVNLQRRTPAWQALFLVGLTGIAVGMLKWFWSPYSQPAAYQTPLAAPAANPAPAPLPVQAQAVPKSKVVPILPPVSSFTPSHIAPADLPPELSGLSRPPPDPEPYVPPIAVQPGYVIPQEPQVRDIR